MDELSKDSNGFTELEASSLAVGLPEGLMGNSEVGHLNIGAGRVVWQDVVRIDQNIKTGEFSKNDVIKRTFESAAAGNGRLHLCGLVSHGGVVSCMIHPCIPPLTPFSSIVTYTACSTPSRHTSTPSSRPPRSTTSPRSSSTSLVMAVTPTPSRAPTTCRSLSKP